MAKAKPKWLLAATVTGDQLIRGTYGVDTLRGEDGNDTINALLGDDFLDGGSGADNIDGGKGIDTVTFTDDTGGPAAEHGVIVNLGSDRLKNVSIPNFGPVTVQARTAVDSYGYVDKLFDIENVTGTDFGDYIVGSDPANRILGAGGDDTLLTGKGDDYAEGGTGNDRIEGGRGNDDLYGGDDNDIVKGDDGADDIFGGLGDDDLNGGTGNDIIDAGDGNDLLSGEAGQDTLTGGAGADRFDFNLPIHSGNGAAARDVITDFKAGGELDVIDLFTIDSRSALPGNQAFTFVAAEGAGFSGAGAEVIWDIDEANNRTLVQGDVNSDGVADFTIELTGQINLVATDFIL